MRELLRLDKSPFFVIAGPCVIESLDLCLEVGGQVKRACDAMGLAYIFKASFDKANRSSNASFRGPGLEAGLKILERVKSDLNVPVLTDIHESHQATIAGRVADVLQVPAFLARQTDLLIACGKTGKTVNVKKGQFMAPQEMALAIDKIKSTGNSNVMLTERGTFFGYGRLVNDITALAVMKQLGHPVVFDITHSTQQPAALGASSGGNSEYSPLLARAAMATGCVDGLFLECHPDPKNAKSDAATMLNLNQVEPLLRTCRQLADVIKRDR
jgi:2-dehydro-3-deoxyphosphooctonate aldolase (KDO 8-P synthase)